MKRRPAWHVAVWLGVSSLATPVFAWGLFPAGSENKSRGLESAEASRGAAAVLYNPANLSLAGDRLTSAELGFAQVTYAYEHPDYDPVVIRVNSPTVTLGYMHRLSDHLNGGFVLFPTKDGDMKIPGVPRKIGEETYVVAVTQKETILNAGYGLSYAIRPGLAIGASLIYSYEQNRTEANLVGSQSRLLLSNAHGHFIRPRLGIRGGGQAAKDLSLAGGVAFLPATRKTYQGSYASSSDPDAHDPKMVNYEPMTVSGGGSLQWRRLGAGFDVNYRQWRAGRRVVKTGIGVDAPAADLHDVWERGGHLSWSVMQDVSVLASYAETPSPWGPGRDLGVVDDRLGGADFGQLDAVNRRDFALGTSAQVAKDAVFDMAVMYAQGSRKLGAGSDHEGYYQLAMTLVSVTLNARF